MLFYSSEYASEVSYSLIERNFTEEGALPANWLLGFGSNWIALLKMLSSSTLIIVSVCLAGIVLSKEQSGCEGL